jgi:hypothetical protein
MANEWKHKRYFKQYNNSTSSYVTFSDTSDAQTKIGFGSCFNANSPTKTYELADSGQTLVVTYEHSSEENQSEFTSAVDAAWTDGSVWTGNTFNTPGDGHTDVPPTLIKVLEVRHVKSEWLHLDGSVSSTTDFSF